jgi:hypothetical protein
MALKYAGVDPLTKDEKALSGRNERGMALLLTLLLLALMSAVVLGMVFSVGSELMVNGYYQNYRGSFYAADSGLNIARQQMVNQVMAAIPGTFPTYPTQPIPSGTDTKVQNSILATYGSGYTSLNSGDAAQSWGGKFEITNTSTTCPTNLALAPSSPTVTAWDKNNNPSAYQYIYNYNICAQGTATGAQQTVVSEAGSIIFNVSASSNPNSISFAAFGGFVDQYPPCFGPLVPGTMTGPMFTNGAWQFMPGGSYIFTDPVGQANADFDFWYGSNCIQSPTSSYKYRGQTISPTFQAGFNLGQPKAPLPPNDFSQEWAVLDGRGTETTSPANSDLNAHLLDISGTPYPTAGATSGVYLGYTSSNGTNTMTGGGIYVQGDATTQLSIGTDSSGNPTQIYTITQGSTTTTVTTDATANTTTVQSGNTTQTISGVPMNYNSSPPQPATMLYVNGNATLSGPGEGQPAIQDGTQLTITAQNNVTFTGDVLYKTEPVTTTQNQIPGTPVDTLIQGNDHNQVLGVFTANGNINLNNQQSDGNIEVDGSLAAISQSGTGGFLNTGAPINVFNNVGGQIQNSIYGAAINTENVYFDRRFTSRLGFAPPWFPSTTISLGGPSSTNTTYSIQRVQWLDQTSTQ